jgi:hypothetical protein
VKAVKLGKFSAYRTDGQESSEGEGIVDSLCLTKGRRMYKINVMRSADDAISGTRILESFRP